MNVCNVNIVGNIGNDPEVRQIRDGLDVLNFSVAVNNRRGDQESTAWFRIAVWGKQAAVLVDLLRKGQTVYVSGRLEPREYEHNGTTRTSLDVTASDVILTGAKPTMEEVENEEIPF